MSALANATVEGRASFVELDLPSGLSVPAGTPLAAAVEYYNEHVRRELGAPMRPAQGDHLTDELHRLDALIEAVVPTDKASTELRDRLVFHLLRSHPWTKSNCDAAKFATEAGEWLVEWVNLAVKPIECSKHVRAVCKRRKQSVPDEYSFANDDMVYACTIDEVAGAYSALLRKYQTRGFTFFHFSSGGTIVTSVVRGLNKFTGLTATDEDDVSSASDQKRLFFESQRSHTESDTLFVTNKSNGENAKGTVRLIGGVWWLLAGSKNTCLPCPISVDPRTVFDQSNPTVPSWMILNAFYDHAKGLQASAEFEAYAMRLDEDDLVILFEFNNEHHEHLFPIHSDYVEAFAMRGRSGVAIHPQEAFEFFARYRFRHVAFSHRPPCDLDAVVSEVRARRDIEGVVVYFLLATNVIGLLKVKSDFYSIARAIRQIFWRMPDAIIRFFAEQRKTSRVLSRAFRMPRYLLLSVRTRMASRMKRMTQIPSHESNAALWTEWGLSFCDWWIGTRLSLAETPTDQLHCAEAAKARFGSLFHDFLQAFDSAGAERWLTEAIEARLVDADAVEEPRSDRRGGGRAKREVDGAGDGEAGDEAPSGDDATDA